MNVATQNKKRFDLTGFLIVDDVFQPNELDPLRRELEVEVDRMITLLHQEGRLTKLHDELSFDERLAAIHQDSKENGARIMEHLEGLRGGGYHGNEMYGLLTHPKLLKIVGQLLGSEEIVGSSVYRIRPKLPNLGKGIVPWHQDSGYLQEHCDSHLIITCWIPLVDATVENGCMRILPKQNGQDYDIVPHYNGGNAGFLVVKDDDLPQSPQDAVPAVCPKGGVVFMSNLTPHCSTPNYSTNIRWSVDLRFQSHDVPSNVGVWPSYVDESGAADEEFYVKANVACYPPEADFVVASTRNPKSVASFDDYVKRRMAYDAVKPAINMLSRWPILD